MLTDLARLRRPAKEGSDAPACPCLPHPKYHHRRLGLLTKPKIWGDGEKPPPIRFGDFCGFVVLTEAGEERRFLGREHAIEELLHQAWIERTVVTVLPDEHDRDWPATLILRRYHWRTTVTDAGETLGDGLGTLALNRAYSQTPRCFGSPIYINALHMTMELALFLQPLQIGPHGRVLPGRGRGAGFGLWH